MVALDTSSLIAFFSCLPGKDTALIERALDQKYGVLPPVVLTEILSDSNLTEEIIALFKRLPVLTIENGFWERAGRNRAKLLRLRLKARLADTLIAQVCIDHGVALVTRDNDFRHFTKHCGLKLLMN